MPARKKSSSSSQRDSNNKLLEARIAKIEHLMSSPAIGLSVPPDDPWGPWPPQPGPWPPRGPFPIPPCPWPNCPLCGWRPNKKFAISSNGLPMAAALQTDIVVPLPSASVSISNYIWPRLQAALVLKNSDAFTGITLFDENGQATMLSANFNPVTSAAAALADAVVRFSADFRADGLNVTNVDNTNFRGDRTFLNACGSIAETYAEIGA